MCGAIPSRLPTPSWHVQDNFLAERAVLIDCHVLVVSSVHHREYKSLQEVTLPHTFLQMYRIYSKVILHLSVYFFLYTRVITVKVKVALEQATKSQRGSRTNATLSLTSALDESGCSAPRPGRFTHGKDPVPIVKEDR
jgi:hypothetical protein